MVSQVAISTTRKYLLLSIRMYYENECKGLKVVAKNPKILLFPWCTSLSLIHE